MGHTWITWVLKWVKHGSFGSHMGQRWVMGVKHGLYGSTMDHICVIWVTHWLTMGQPWVGQTWVIYWPTLGHVGHAKQTLAGAAPGNSGPLLFRQWAMVNIFVYRHLGARA